MGLPYAFASRRKLCGGHPAAVGPDQDLEAWLAAIEADDGRPELGSLAAGIPRPAGQYGLQEESAQRPRQNGMT
jgi:hypothetical protein